MVAWRTGVYVGMSLPAILYILTVVGTDGYPYPIPHLQELIIIYSGFTLPIIFLMLFSCNI
ncbi:MAG: hypothetical protein BJ554DRAFT_7246 [Olpidium bornovanus]|uniref:Uncharacterized protein n=1 Tax=Olpidium bornovanus TaxID=278681 RepID=A0A8H8DK06_9FUNG|nr:MAG: hypothetical protein BJ554DRAFT_7246 [Olpidium bornovanus]